MANFSGEKLQHLQELLNEREKTLRDDIKREVGTQESYGEIAPTISDPGDASFADLTHDLGNAAVTRDLIELRAIEAARSRMEQGTYGDCIECGYEIPLARLEAQPMAERCAPCQEMYEKTHADGLRGGTL